MAHTRRTLTDSQDQLIEPSSGEQANKVTCAHKGLDTTEEVGNIPDI